MEGFGAIFRVEYGPGRWDMARRKILPNALDVDFRGGLTDEVTPHAGVALLVELGRISGVMGGAEKHLPAKKNPKGLGQGQMVESFVLLSALGGEGVDDLGTSGGTGVWQRSWDMICQQHLQGGNGWSGAFTRRDF